MHKLRGIEMKRKILVVLLLILAMTFTACTKSAPKETDNPQNELEEYIENPG